MPQESLKRAINLDNIDWLVLDERGGKLLLLAKGITEKRPYNADRFCAAWEDSTLREHLGGGRFLLSVEEVDRYFADDTARIAYFQGAPRAWWLRDIGIKNHAAFVGKDGSVSIHGYRVDCAWCGVRPAVWVESGIS
jgi:hypothetical protein